MNLQVRLLEEGAKGQPVYVLCDGEGRMLPNQMGMVLELDTNPETPDVVHVAFEIDGRAVKLTAEKVIRG